MSERRISCRCRKERDSSALRDIAQGNYAGQYVQDIRSGEYHAVNWQPNLAQYFKL